MEENEKKVDEREGKLAFASGALNIYGDTAEANPWSADDVDKLGVMDFDEYQELVEMCRFFYKRDPLASTVINRMVDLAINDIVLIQGDLSDNEFSIYEALKKDLTSFAENVALEYMISGLVVPESKYIVVNKTGLKRKRIKRYSSLILPKELWLRDPATIVINSSLSSSNPSYFVKISDDFAYFIRSEGTYKDGTQDKEKYLELLKYYPEFVKMVMDGAKEVKFENDKIVRRRYLTDSPYPIPYLYAALESMKHKRNLRRMDYSLAARAITAIQVFRLGSDEFPVLADDQVQFDNLRSQMRWRNQKTKDVERIFQLFANHTLEIEWVYPPMEALLDDTKYKDINNDIVVALGFPRILITGESEKSNASSAEYAMMPAIEAISRLRKKVLGILDGILFDISEYNGFSDFPEVTFRQLNLHEFASFVEALSKLYDTGNLSRASFAEIFGYRWKEEMKLREGEEKLMKELDLPEFQPQPHSQDPQQGGNPSPTKRESPE